MVAKEREKESGVLPRGKSLKDKASDVINYFLRVKHDGFIEFFQIFFFFLFNNCENYELSALRDRCYTSPFNVDYPR